MITINLDKAKAIAHDQRRKARAKEFAPFDEVIAKQIPGIDAIEAEASRQAIRDRYATLQGEIEAAATPEEILAVLEELPATNP